MEIQKIYKLVIIYIFTTIVKAITSTSKREKWTIIASNFKARADVPRDVPSLQKKWDNLVQVHRGMYMDFTQSQRMTEAACTTEVSDFVKLYEYKDFSSTWPFYHTVPKLTNQAIWSFQVENKYPESCENKNVTIVLQHGSLPVVNPLNETFPDNFYVNKSNYKSFYVMSNNLTLVSGMVNPEHGPWYGVAYLPKSDGRMKPHDLFVECSYKLKTWFYSESDTEIDILTTEEKHDIIIPGHKDHTYRFFLPLTVQEYSVTLSNCSHGNNTGCAVFIATRGQGIPGPKHSTLFKPCDSSDADCELKNFTPEVNVWHYLRIQSDTDDNSSFSISFSFTGCQETMDESHDQQSDSVCLISPMLDRFSYNSKYKSKFIKITEDAVKDVIITMTENQSTAVPFQLEDGQDTGGSLVVKLDLKTIVAVDNSFEVRIDACLQKHKIPVNVDITFCNNGYHDYLNNTASQGQRESKVIIPYPQAGVWFVGMLLRCYKRNSNDTNSEVNYQPCGDLSADVNVSVTTDACVEAGCNKHGRCMNFLNGKVLYSTCRCSLGWRGFDCSDGTESHTELNQLLELLLLTISNIVFVPAIILALYRRHYVEALVYAYTMTFSGLYHACDGDRTDVYKFCLLRLSILSTCDFLGSAVSIWVTLVAMSRPPLRFKAVMQIVGPLAILVGVLVNRYSAFLFLVPAGLGILTIWISWVCRCCYRHKCYPSKKKYCMCLIPGLLIAGGGLAIFTFLKNESNYLYTHSAWHVCMGLSILFLLPPRESRIYNVKQGNIPVLNSTYQPIRTDENHVI